MTDNSTSNSSNSSNSANSANSSVDDARDASETDSVTSPDTIGASNPSGSGNLEKDPSDWVSGDDPMTAAQRSYLDTLARQAGEELPADLNKAEASQHIDRLRSQSSSGD